MSETPVPAQGESLRTVLVALLANAAIAAAKLAAAALTRSSALLAEAFHALADTGNQVLLVVAERRSRAPADPRHPMGHGREAYFWALIASLGVFLTGALLSFREGLEDLLHPTPVASFTTAYAVLAVAFALECVSLARAYRQIRAEARRLSREFLEHLDLSSDPIARAVFAEDAAAVAGNVIAALGIGLHQATGSPVWDGLAAMAIGLSLGYVAFELARRNADFLIGLQASPGIEHGIEKTLQSQPGVRRVTELVATFLGPRKLWVVARLEMDDALGGAHLKSLLHAAEETLLGESPFIARVDLCPVARSEGAARRSPRVEPVRLAETRETGRHEPETDAFGDATQAAP